MSLVMGFVTSNYILICGDKRVKMSQDIFTEDFKKVYYCNEDIIYGFVG